MSRIGKKSIPLPSKVSASIEGNFITIKGPKGTLSKTLPSLISIEEKENLLICTPNDSSRQANQMLGLGRTLVANMVEGVSTGFSSTLELVGVGYRSQVEGNSLVLNVGYSHPVTIPPNPDIKIKVEKNTTIIVEGIDKELVGKTAANIRSVRPPEPYKGKGIRRQGEFIKRKAGKTGKK